MDVQEAAAENPQYKKFWSWHGPEDLISVLTIVAWTFILLYWRNSGIVMSSAVTLMCCASPFYRAKFGRRGSWNRYQVSVMRVGVAVGAGWMFLEIPALGARLAALAAVAALYIACERIAWRWVRSRTLTAA